MNASTLLAACCLVRCSTRLTSARPGRLPSRPPDPQSAASISGAADCGGEPCDAVARRHDALVMITLPLPPNLRLIEPVTNTVSNETCLDVWRTVPTVDGVALTF